MCPSVNRKLPPAGWKLYGSLSLRLFIATVQPPAGPHPSAEPSALAPSRLNGPSLSAQQIPWSFDRAAFGVPFRYTSGRPPHSTTTTVVEVPSVTSAIRTCEFRCITANRLAEL